MKRHFRHSFWWDFSPFHFHFWGPWGARFSGFGFPRREDYLHMLEEYQDELQEMQREIAEELEEVEREIEELRREPPEGGE